MSETNEHQLDISTRNGAELPLRTAPIRFAVMRSGGLTSNSWGVKVEPKGDAYVYCRDDMKDQKVSLHASGKQHVSFNKNARNLIPYAGDRFLNRWSEPQHTKKAVPTLRLLFPSWGLSLNAEQRNARGNWDRNNVEIPGHHEMVTVVSFVIVDDGTRLRKAEGSPPSQPFGVLRLRAGKSLFVIAGYEPERDLRTKVHEALKKIASTVDPNLLKGEELTICLTGRTAKNSVFMLPLACRYTPPSN